MSSLYTNFITKKKVALKIPTDINGDLYIYLFIFNMLVHVKRLNKPTCDDKRNFSKEKLKILLFFFF